MPPRNWVFLGVGSILFFYCFYVCLYYYSLDDPISFQRLSNLEQQLAEKLYGQHIAAETVVKSLKLHYMMPTKALGLVLYGEKGTGKSTLVNTIKDALYYPENVHTFTPEDLRQINQIDSLKKIEEEIEKHPESLFIFDHVEKMSPILLNGLLSYLDYTYYGRNNNLRKPVYIFISTNNSPPDILMKKLYNNFYKSGNSRNSARLDDFEDNLKKFLFNDRKSGFYGSKLIRKGVIDHFIPFLPLEKDHIRKCIRDNFASKGINANEEHVNEVLTYLEWVPQREQVYAVGGCKGLNQKVILVKTKHNLQKD